MTDHAQDRKGDRLIHLPEISELTTITVATLRWMRNQGEGPPIFRLGRRLVCWERDLYAWIAEHAAEAPSTPSLAPAPEPVADSATDEQARKFAADMVADVMDGLDYDDIPGSRIFWNGNEIWLHTTDQIRGWLQEQFKGLNS
jgi:predicted DNA-binding transcriptional regulator AlpA